MVSLAFVAAETALGNEEKNDDHNAISIAINMQYIEFDIEQLYKQVVHNINDLRLFQFKSDESCTRRRKKERVFFLLRREKNTHPPIQIILHS
jgi:hypothetical protein